MNITHSMVSIMEGSSHNEHYIINHVTICAVVQKLSQRLLCLDIHNTFSAPHWPHQSIPHSSNTNSHSPPTHLSPHVIPVRHQLLRAFVHQGAGHEWRGQVRYILPIVCTCLHSQDKHPRSSTFSFTHKIPNTKATTPPQSTTQPPLQQPYTPHTPVQPRSTSSSLSPAATPTAKAFPPPKIYSYQVQLNIIQGLTLAQIVVVSSCQESGLVATNYGFCTTASHRLQIANFPSFSLKNSV